MQQRRQHTHNNKNNNGFRVRSGVRRRHRGPAHLCVEIVDETVLELRLDGVLLCEEGEVVGQLVVSRQDGAVTERVVLRPTRSTKDLHDVKDAEVDKRTLLGVVDLRALQNRQGTKRGYWVGRPLG